MSDDKTTKPKPLDMPKLFELANGLFGVPTQYPDEVWITVSEDSDISPFLQDLIQAINEHFGVRDESLHLH